MSGLSRMRGCSLLLLGSALLLLPSSLQAQSAREREVEERLRRVEERLQTLREERRLLIEEAMAQVERELAQVTERLREREALEAATLALTLQELAESQEIRKAREAVRRETLERVRARIRAQEEQVRQRAQELQQVMVRMRARIRLGVSLDGLQGEEYDLQGARVQGIIEDSPAEEAGLQEGDIITHLNGHPLLNPLPEEEEAALDDEESLPVQRLMALARELEPGEAVELRYLRDGEPRTVTFDAADMEPPGIAVYRRGPGEGWFRFEPGERGVWSFTLPEEGVFEFEMPEMEKLEDLDLKLQELYVDTPGLRYRAWPHVVPEELEIRRERSPFVYGFFGQMGRFGLEIAELNPGLAEYFSVDEGILVLDVEDDSPLGLAPGDVILAIGEREVEDPEDVRRILGSYEEDETIALRVVRKGREMLVEGTIR